MELVARTLTAGLFLASREKRGGSGEEEEEEAEDECFNAVIRLIGIGSLWIMAFRTVLPAPSLPPSFGRSGNR